MATLAFWRGRQFATVDERASRLFGNFTCTMEIQYQNTRSDFKVAYENFMQRGKAAQRSDFYYGVLWYFAVLALACYIALKNGEIFAACVFAAIGGLYLKQNWSFTNRWAAAADSYVAMLPECSCTLALDEHGLTERFSGVD